MRSIPRLMECWCIPILFLPGINLIFMLCRMCYILSLTDKITNRTYTEFNNKYEAQRGVHLERDLIAVHTAKGTRFVEGIKVTVNQPAVPIPGVQLFTPCKDSLIAIQTYAKALPGQETGGKPLQGPDPSATPAGCGVDSVTDFVSTKWFVHHKGEPFVGLYGKVCFFSRFSLNDRPFS